MAIENVEKLVIKLRELAAKSQKEGNPVVAVGFTAAYALHVHENMEMLWKGLSRDPRIRRIEMGGDPEKARPRPRKKEPKGRYWDPQDRATSKFLEGPARELREVFGQIIMKALMQGKTLTQGLLLAGLRLQREAQLRVPVDTGNLKASAFTRLEAGTPEAGAIPV